MNRIYFDNAATTPLLPEVMDVMNRAMRELYGNPSSIHKEGRTARTAIEQARKTVAQHLGASIGEIFFTSGGTESNNMALKGAVRDLGVRRIISTRIEHHCILHSLDTLAKQNGVEIVFLDLDDRGRPNLRQLEAILAFPDSPKTLVSLMHANNEIGTMIDLDEVAGICRAAGAFFHTDTVQTIGYYPIDVSRTPISFLSGSAHKFHGPKGAGFVYINSDNIIRPFIDGGAQERNMRGGTENIYGILGLAKALELAGQEMDQRRRHMEDLRACLQEALIANFEGLHFNGDWDGRAHYKTLSVAFPPSSKTDLLLLNLDIAGIAASGGSACSSGADAGSHVLEEIYGPDDQRKTIRFSLSHLNKREELDMVIAKLKEILPTKAKIMERE